MHRESTTRHHTATAAAIALAFSLVAYPALTQANDWGAAEATSGQMDDHEATSGDPDEMTVGSETMDGRAVESENPASMVTGAGQLDEQEGSSTDLTNLKKAKPGRGFRRHRSTGAVRVGNDYGSDGPRGQKASPPSAAARA